MPGSLTTRDWTGPRDIASVASAAIRRRHPGLNDFRGSMAGLCSPPPTLRLAPHDARRMTRGQCGSLLLHCEGLSPSTPCRSPGAHWLRFEKLTFARGQARFQAFLIPASEAAPLVRRRSRR